MDDQRCVRFLQWALPLLRKRWPGFRKVRKQVCKRLQRRIDELGLVDVQAYRRHLQDHADEWSTLDHLCRVTVSRFYRDKVVLQHLSADVLPELARGAVARGDNALRGWSAGCAMGEEAYTLVLIWNNVLQADFSELGIEVVGSDIDDQLLRRARRACYSYSSVKALPEDWLRSDFLLQQQEYCLSPRVHSKVTFIRGDMRNLQNLGCFDLVLCRNIAFTYFEESLQLAILNYIGESLVEGGALIIGGHEALPDGYGGFEPWSTHKAIFRKTGLSG
jgi:chemotaxis protein methyltransferase CheR